MRVVVISDYGYVNGGGARVAFDSIRLLTSVGIDVVLVCGSRRVDRDVLPKGIKVVSLDQDDLLSDPHRIRAMINGIWNCRAYAVVSKLLKSFDARDTVVHVHGWCKIFSPSLLAAIRRSGLKCFLTCHDYFVSCPNGAFFDYVHKSFCQCQGGELRCLVCNCDARSYLHKIWRWFRQAFIRYQLKRFDGIRFVTISDGNDTLITRSMGTDSKCIRINNPINVVSGAENSIEHKHDFLFIGRASAEKGLELFAEAIERAHVNGVVIGDGPELNRIKLAHPHVECLGWKNESEIFAIARQRAAVLVFPSLLPEGSPLAPLEMMALNIPCIISDQTAAVEYIKDGKTGLKFKSGDVVDLIYKIEMMNDPLYRERISDNIRREFDISKWSGDSHLAKLLAAYRKVMSEA